MQAKKFLVCIAAMLLIICASMALTAHAADVQLAWNAPKTNADGTPLTDLAGYRVYYGQSSGQYDTSVDVGLSTTAILSGLIAGQTYYFAATTYDSSGNESNFSNEISAIASDFSLTATPRTVAAGGALSVSWLAPAERPSTDWIGLYKTGATNKNFLWWTYTNGTRSGTATLKAPSTPGTYVFRYLLDNGYKSVAKSKWITVK